MENVKWMRHDCKINMYQVRRKGHIPNIRFIPYILHLPLPIFHFPSKKRIVLLFETNAGGWSVARINFGFIR